MKNQYLIWILLMSVLAVGFHSPDSKRPMSSLGRKAIEDNQKRNIRAVDFPENVDWLNVSRPLTLDDLKGKVVLLDFWTYACINCMHVIPDLKKLEARYPTELAVIGVHSAKFNTEKISENIRQSIMRYEVKHPVLNDSQFHLWNTYGVQAWPTLILIDPEGRVVASVSGEGHYSFLDQTIRFLIEQRESNGKAINENPLPLAYEGEKMETGELSFPGKVFAGKNGLVVSDTNHHQIIVSDFSGRIEFRIGSGQAGIQDGNLETAAFQYPQGVFRDGHLIYVADTGNHLVREIDLAGKTVKTIAGTGVQGGFLHRKSKALKTALNSPWDLVKIKDRLFITMAGAHQIWELRLKNGTLQLFAGSGQEDIRDGAGTKSALAQPSGIAFDGKDTLYIADSEASGIRSVHLKSGKVKTLIGKGLFEFGDRDGSWSQARLQHPLGVAYENNLLYVADTYNSKIKQMNLTAQTINALNGPSDLLDEPGGLSVWENKIYIADTNHHAVRVFDLSSSLSETIKFSEETISKIESKGPAEPSNPFLQTIRNEKVSVIEGAKMSLKVVLPQDHEFTEGVPLHLKVELKNNAGTKLLQDREYPDPVKALPVYFDLGPAAEGESVLQVEADIPYCSVVQPKLCKFKSFRWIQPVQFSPDGLGELVFNAEI